MKKIIEFLKSTNAPLIGLVAMVFGLFQMYAKTYYSINPISLNLYVDVLISLVVAAGFSLATTIIIVHTQKKSTPIIFAIFDFLGYMLFFAASFMIWSSNKEYYKILGAIFVSGLSAVIIYYFGEIFISEIREKIKKANELNNLNLDYQNAIAQLQKEKTSIETQLHNSKNELNSLRNEFKSLIEKDSQNTELIYRIKEISVEKENEILRLTVENRELNEQKSIFIENNNPESLKQTLKGYKASYTRAMNEGRNETANELEIKIKQLSKILNIETKYAEAN